MSFYYLSYEKSDALFVDNILLPQLNQNGFNKWITQREALTNPEFNSGVSSAINRSYGVVLVVSAASMKSENVKFEWGFAHYIHKPIIPVMIEPPEVISSNGSLEVVYDVHEKLARETWYNFSDASYYEWDALNHALYSLADHATAPVTTVTMKALNI